MMIAFGGKSGIDEKEVRVCVVSEDGRPSTTLRSAWYSPTDRGAAVTARLPADNLPSSIHQHIAITSNIKLCSNATVVHV